MYSRGNHRILDDMAFPDSFREHVAVRVHEILAQTEDEFGPMSPDVSEFLAPAFALTSGGKRMRALLMATGYRAAGSGSEITDSVVELGAALELFQAAALVHDDIIDDSDTRRSQPSTHVKFSALAPADALETPRVFGKNAAILLGDLLIVLADQAAARAFEGHEQRVQERCRRLWDEMTSEVAIGQYLDTLNSTLPLRSVSSDEALAAALKVVRHKSARYSVEHPLTLGAALGGGNDALIKCLKAVGLPLGEAFQLRDDDLGVFGNPEATGKPAGDDLREGKRTPLLAITRQLADSDQRRLIEQHLGDRAMPSGVVETLRSIVIETGARSRHEALIDERLSLALDAIDKAGLPDAPAQELMQHARNLAHRDA